MSNPVFPTLSVDQDSSLYSESLENPAMTTDMEGGYQVSRKKFTRAPRASYTTGFNFLSQADKVMLDAFWVSVGGAAVIFDWTNPVTQAVVAVRFSKDPLQYKYTGAGDNFRWQVQFKLDQA